MFISSKEKGYISGHFPTCMCRGGTWLGFERAIARTEDERATIVPATRLACLFLASVVLRALLVILFCQLLVRFCIGLACC